MSSIYSKEPSMHLLSRALMRISLAILLMCAIALSYATDNATADENFLPVEEAFVVNHDISNGALNLIFDIAPKYYLYKGRFKFWLEDSAASGTKIDTGIKVDLAAGKHKDDPYFGPVQVYYGQLVIPVGFSLDFEQQANILAEIDNYKLFFRYQGCAEAGLCYPPQTLSLALKDLLDKGLSIPSAATELGTQTPAQEGDNTNNASSQASKAADNPLKKNTQAIQNPPEQDFFSAGNLASLLQTRGAIGLFIFFLLGVLLTFTPCVLPMIPILSSIVLGNKSLTPARASFLSCVYVLGMAITYALLGVLVAHFGAKANLQLYLQQPWVIMLMAALFVALAMSMFGFFEIKLPRFIHEPLAQANHKMQGGSALGVLVMGIISALVVSPCVSAPLAGTLIYIGTTGDVLFGGLSLFSLAIGMGVPLILIGTLGPRFLPESGAWLNMMKLILGMLLIGVAVWLLTRITVNALDNLLWAVWCLGFAVILGTFKNAASKSMQIVKLLGIVLTLVAGAFLYQAYQHNFKRTAGVLDQQAIKLHTVTSYSGLQQALKQNSSKGLYTVVDLYAQWCVSCIIMEEEIFLQADVHAELKQIAFLKYDATDVGEDTKRVFSQYDVKGLPNIMLFDPQQNEVKEARILGEVDKTFFVQHMKTFIK